MLSRSEFIVEQRGWRTFFWVLIPCLVIGLAFRLMFSEKRITLKVREAAQNLGAHYTVDFSRASLSLADGIFPDFAILIEDIKIVSHRTHERFEFVVDDIRIPLEISALFEPQPQLRSLEIGHADLVWLESTWPEFSSPKPSSSSEQDSSSSPLPKLESSHDQSVTTTRSTSLTEVSLRSLRMQFPMISDSLSGAQLRSLRLKLDPVPFLSAQYSVPGYIVKSDSPITGQLSGQFGTDGRPQSLQMSLSWREAQALVDFKFDPQMNHRAIQLDYKLNTLPLVPFLVAAQRFGWDGLKEEPLSHQVWLNSQGHIHWLASESIADAKMKVDFFEIDGDWGRIHFQDGEFEKLGPLKASEKIQVFVEKLELSSLFGKLFRIPKPGYISEYGDVRGELTIEPSGELKFIGEASGLSLVLSNLGRRAEQVFSMIRIELKKSTENFEISLDRFRLLDGLLFGKIKFEETKSKKQSLIVNIEEMSLGPDVQEILTSGGELGMLSLRGLLNREKDTSWVGSLDGAVAASQIAGLTFKEASLKLSQKDQQITAGFRSPEIMILPESPISDFFETTFRNLSPVGAMWFKGLVIELNQQSLDAVSWQAKADFQKFGRAASQGSWNAEGFLSGELSLRPLQKDWKIEGTRSSPLFIEKELVQ